MELSENVPQNIKTILQTFVCPITTQIVKTPIIASDGRIYEESVFRQYVENNKQSPVTREPILDQYYVSYDIKQVIDTLEKLYPEIQNLRYKEDYYYKNNISRIGILIKKRRISELLEYKDFDLKDMIKHNYIEKIMKNGDFFALPTIINNSIDCDNDLLLLLICKSLCYKKCREFIKYCLTNYMVKLNAVSLGIIFNNACEKCDDVTVMIDIIFHCNDINSLCIFTNNRTWSYYLAQNELDSEVKNEVIESYYIKLMQLTNNGKSEIIKKEYFLDETWRSLKYENDDYSGAPESPKRNYYSYSDDDNLDFSPSIQDSFISRYGSRPGSPKSRDRSRSRSPKFTNTNRSRSRSRSRSPKFTYGYIPRSISISPNIRSTSLNPAVYVTEYDQN